MPFNAAGLDVTGSNNPNWKGGLISKVCEVCSTPYQVKLVHRKSRFCSMSCVGRSRRGKPLLPPEQAKRTEKICEVCDEPYSVPTSHSIRYHCCSKECSAQRRSMMNKGEQNPNWNGGLSRLPYPWNFREISRNVIARDGATCQNPTCKKTDARLTTHHINYDKQDCRPNNLICLCSACNSRANFDRPSWQQLYQEIMLKKDGGGWKVEEF